MIPNLTPTMVTMTNPESVASEAYRILRTNIVLRDVDKNIKVINVISTTAQEGKSTTVLNLAAVFSQMDKKVLVLDLDLRMPSLHKKLNLKNEKGVTDVVSGQVKFSDAVIHYADNYDILFAGTKIPFSAEFIQTDTMRQFIKQARQYYDLVILDCPPVSLVTDGILASALADGTILVCASNVNEKRDLLRTKDQLTQMHANVLGVVMTRMSVDKKHYGKYGYGGYGYGYGEEPEGKKKRNKKKKK
jgi:capsular exopolysaccharide synthesis family protein